MSSDLFGNKPTMTPMQHAVISKKHWFRVQPSALLGWLKAMQIKLLAYTVYIINTV